MTNETEQRVRDLDAAAWAEVPCPNPLCANGYLAHPAGGACATCNPRGKPSGGTILRPDLAWLRDVLRGKAASQGEECPCKCHKGQSTGKWSPHHKLCVQKFACTGRIGAEPGWDGIMGHEDELGRDHESCPDARGNCIYYYATPDDDSMANCHGTGWVLHPLLRQLVEAGYWQAAIGFVLDVAYAAKAWNVVTFCMDVLFRGVLVGPEKAWAELLSALRKAAK